MSEEDNTGTRPDEEYSGKYAEQSSDYCPMSGSNKCPTDPAVQAKCPDC